MQIKVKLFATLRQGRTREMFLDVGPETVPQNIIDLLEIPTGDVAILLINGRDGELDAKLNEADVLSIFPPVGGG